MLPARTISRFCQRVGDLGFALLLAATAADATAAGQICTSADTIEFGNLAVGNRATASATVSNCGDAAWSFTSVYVDPATGPEFHVDTTCTIGLTLMPGATRGVSVVFAPTATGQTSGGLWLDNTTSTPDQLITFYGRGINSESGSASLAFVPASANFLRRRGSASILQYAQHIESVVKVETDVDQNQVGLEGGNLADRPLRRCAVTDQVRTGRSNSRG